MMLQPNNNRSTINSLFFCRQVLEIFDFNGCKGQEGGKYAWAVVSVLCFAVGFPASLSNLCELFRTQRAGNGLTPNDFYMLNLSIMDAVFLLFIPPGLINQFVWENRTFEAVWNGTYALNTSGRPLLMACTCLDCYVAVVHPIIYRQKKSLLPRILPVSLVWTVTFATSLAYSCSYELFFSPYPTVIYVFATIIIVICDSFIIWSLLRSGPGKRNIHPQKQRAIQTLAYSSVMALMAYLPPVFFFNMWRYLTSNEVDFMCTIGIPLTNTSTIGSAVMPLIVLYNAGRLGCFRCACSNL